MSHPKELAHFMQWVKLMTAQARVPDRVRYKAGEGKSSSTSSTRKPKRRKRRIRRNRRNRHKQD